MMRPVRDTALLAATLLTSACLFVPGAVEDDEDAQTSGQASDDGDAQDTEGDEGDDDDDESSDDGSSDSADSDGDDASFCVDECDVDEDCDAGGSDIGLSCEDSRCVGEATSCSDDAYCIAQLSGWSAGMACTTQAECEALLMSCIEVDGEGHCASSPSEFVSCADSQLDEIELENIEGDTVTVCGNSNAECREDGSCFSPCQSDDDCFDYAPSCNTDTGVCECTSDSDCDALGSAATSVCLDSGACGCGTDDDCTDAGTGDVCTSYGVCGCSGDAACEDVESPYDGTTVVCGQ
jgi:hypothetical protein